MATGERKDPYRGYNFRIEIDGIDHGGFREASGLDSSQDPIEYREGTDPMHVRKLPGLNKYSNLTLKWGITDRTGLWDWRLDVASGKGPDDVPRKDISVILVDDAGEEKWRWNLMKAWPTKWTAPGFNATANEVAVETLELSYEELLKG